MLKEVGGTVGVQDPETAALPQMPQPAIRTGRADFGLPIEQIGAAPWFGFPSSRRLPRPPVPPHFA